jgi:Flp pilus assembly protein TadG
VSARRHRARGAALVEMALAVPVLVMLVFGAIEIMRAIYTWNAVHAVMYQVGRAAATAAFNSASLDTVKSSALLMNGGVSGIAPDVGVGNIDVKYLSLDLNEVSAPADANLNIANCKAAPAGAACVRFVQVRLCSGSSCDAVKFHPIMPVLPQIAMPSFLTIVPVQSLACSTPCT